MKRKELLTTIIFGLTALAILAVSILSFNTTVNEELEKSAKSTLSDLANQQQINFDRQIESMMYNISNIAETLPIIGINEIEIFDYLEEKQQHLNMANIMVVDINGIVYLDNKIAGDFSGTEHFEVALSGELYATKPFYSEFAGKDVVMVTAPIYENGVVDGVLAVEYCTEYLGSLLTTFTDNRGLNLIIDSDSNILISTNEFVLSFEAFKNAKFEGDATFESVVSDFKEGSQGSISYEMNGVLKFGEYRPLEINDWILFFEISEESLVSSVNNISSSMLIISILMLIFAFITVVYVVISKNNSAKVLEQAAYYDELTGIPNLLRFKMLVAESLKKNPNKRFTMVKMDIMNFKAINEMFGFETGNAVICAIANTGKNVENKSFIQARMSSDEFIMFAEGELFDNLEESSKNYELLFKSMLPQLDEHQFNFRYGRYFVTHKDVDVNDIVQKTNTAHSFAKADTARNICDYDEKFTERVLRETEIANKMKKALAQDEFKVYLQPKYDVVNGEVVGAEALVRWIEADGKMIFPNDFIPLFERNGFIVDLDMYMLKNVCEKLAYWKSKGKGCIPISVNFSRLHLNNRNFIREIKDIVDSFGVLSRCIEIELTESTVMEKEEELKSILHELHSEGFLVSIDDFGSGYSSLGMLKNFEVDTLKLDRSFFINVENEQEQGRGDLVVESVVRLADSLGMKTVAEGIEEQSQVEFLKKIKCDAAQGYFYAKPLPLDEFEKQCFKD